MRGSLPLLPQYSFMAWCSVKKQHKDSFVFAFTLTFMMFVVTVTPLVGEGQYIKEQPKVNVMDINSALGTSSTLRVCDLPQFCLYRAPCSIGSFTQQSLCSLSFLLLVI
jgi:hypothetical protein